MIISGGTAVAVRGEVELSLIGVAYMLASEFFEAVKLVMTQILLVDRKFGSVEGLAVVGPAAMAALCVCTILGEDWRDAMEKVGERPLLFLAASLGGVVVNLATNMMVAATSALTLRVTSLLRNIGIVFVSTAVLRDSTLTLLEGIGFCIALTGFVLYQHARRNPAHSFADIWRDLRCPAGDGAGLAVFLTQHSPYLTGTPTHFRGGSSASSPSAASGTSPSGSYAPSCVIKSPVAVRKLYLPGPMGWPSLAKVPT